MRQVIAHLQDAQLEQPVLLLLDELLALCQTKTRGYAEDGFVAPDRTGHIQALANKCDRLFIDSIRGRKSGTAFDRRVHTLRTLTGSLQRLGQWLSELQPAPTHPSADLCRKQSRFLERLLRMTAKGLVADRRRAGVKIGKRLDTLNQSLADIEGALRATPLPDPVAASRDPVLMSLISAEFSRIADALVQLDLGQVASVQNYRRLYGMAQRLNRRVTDLTVEPLAVTRSGSQIGQVAGGDAGPLAVYKEGASDKLREEVEGVERWRAINPRLAPKILSHSLNTGGHASLMIQHLRGQTLESLFYQEHPNLDAAFKHTLKTLTAVWKDTCTQVPINPKFMHQLASRLPQCRRLHPELFAQAHSLCGHERASFEGLMAQVGDREADWRAPFSVLIHGDCNLDNILYEADQGRVYFIDLHRSAYFDYVQDVSVMLVSMYRLPLMMGQSDPNTRLRVQLSSQVLAAGRRFAKRHSDTTFEVRLAAGMARSLASSSRFVADRALARRMVLRARFLLEQLVAVKKPERYKIPLEELYAA